MHCLMETNNYQNPKSLHRQPIDSETFVYFHKLNFNYRFGVLVEWKNIDLAMGSTCGHVKRIISVADFGM